MPWETKTHRPEQRHTLEHGPITLTITEGAAANWLHFIISFGGSTTEPPEECRKTWPREAIARARKALDELEASLGE